MRSDTVMPRGLAYRRCPCGLPRGRVTARVAHPPSTSPCIRVTPQRAARLVRDHAVWEDWQARLCELASRRTEGNRSRSCPGDCWFLTAPESTPGSRYVS